MKIAIATTSIEKIQGIRYAFSRFFEVEESQIEIISQKTESGVANQPFDEATYAGAFNRVENIKRKIEADYYASCEAGIDSFSDLYFNVHVVCIYEVKTGKHFFGKSAGWQIPKEAISLIKQTSLDTYLRKNKGINSIEEMLGDENSRRNAVAQATELALVASKF